VLVKTCVFLGILLPFTPAWPSIHPKQRQERRVWTYRSRRLSLFLEEFLDLIGVVSRYGARSGATVFLPELSSQKVKLKLKLRVHLPLCSLPCLLPLPSPPSPPYASTLRSSASTDIKSSHLSTYRFRLRRPIQKLSVLFFVLLPPARRPSSPPSPSTLNLPRQFVAHPSTKVRCWYALPRRNVEEPVEKRLILRRARHRREGRKQTTSRPMERELATSAKGSEGGREERIREGGRLVSRVMG